MATFEIITDGSAEFFDGYLKDNPIKALPFLFDDKGYHPVSLKDANEEMEKILSDGKDVLYIGMSSSLSHSFENVAYIAKGLRIKYPESKIEFIDSKLSSSALGLMVRFAKKMQEEGKSIDEVVSYLENNKNKFKLLFLLEDPSSPILNYNLAQNSSMDIKPIFAFVDGILQVRAKVLGRKKSIIELIKIIRKEYDPNFYDYITIEYFEQEIEAQELKEQLLKELPSLRIEIISAKEFVYKQISSAGIGIAFIAK